MAISQWLITIVSISIALSQTVASGIRITDSSATIISTDEAVGMPNTHCPIGRKGFSMNVLPSGTKHPCLVWIYLYSTPLLKPFIYIPPHSPHSSSSHPGSLQFFSAGSSDCLSARDYRFVVVQVGWLCTVARPSFLTKQQAPSSNSLLQPV